MFTVNYILTAFLGLGWAIGFFAFNPGREVHILLLLAMVTASAIISRREFVFKKKIISK